MLEVATIGEGNRVRLPGGAGTPISMPGERNDLGRRIREKLAAAAEARRLRQEQRRQATRELDERLKRYTTIADRLMDEVIQPCMRQLAGCFPEAERPDEMQSRHAAVCRFPHTARFPATAILELGVTRDGDARSVVVQYDLQILPLLLPINAHAHLDMPLGEVDQQTVAHWVEERILTFVDSYLQVETAELYHA